MFNNVDIDTLENDLFSTPNIMHIKIYESNMFIPNDIEILEIDGTKEIIQNIPPSVTRIYIHKAINVLRNQIRLPYGCELFINSFINYHHFENITDIDYNDIKYLGLGEDKIFPEIILKFKNLERLSLQFTSINEIPEEILTLSKLQFLHLPKRIIRKCPEWLTNNGKFKVTFN